MKIKSTDLGESWKIEIFLDNSDVEMAMTSMIEIKNREEILVRHSLLGLCVDDAQRIFIGSLSMTLRKECAKDDVNNHFGFLED